VLILRIVCVCVCVCAWCGVLWCARARACVWVGGCVWLCVRAVCLCVRAVCVRVCVCVCVCEIHTPCGLTVAERV